MGEGRFLFPSPPPSSLEPAILLHPIVLGHTVSPIVVSKIEVFDGDGGPYMRFISSSDLVAPHSASLSGISTHAREIANCTIAFHDSFSLPPPSLLPIHLR